jgi:hypothetical protein
MLTTLRSRRWIVSALSGIGGVVATRRVSAAFPRLRQEGEMYNGRQVTIVLENDAFVIQIDGVPVDTAIPVVQVVELGPEATPAAAIATPEAEVLGAFSSDFFPFRTFDSPEEIARALVDTEGQLWILGS